LTGLVHDVDASTPDMVHPEDDVEDDEELITGSESPDKTAAVFDKFDDESEGVFDDELEENAGPITDKQTKASENEASEKGKAKDEKQKDRES